MSYRIGIDIGGTFTDMVFLAADGALVVTKAPTTPDDFSRGIADGRRWRGWPSDGNP